MHQALSKSHQPIPKCLLLTKRIMTDLSKSLYEFGPFRMDPSERLLLRHGRPIPLAPKVFDTLLVLLRNAGRLVTKDDLMSLLWPDTFVQESTLARNISDLRKTLGDAGDGYSFIETVPKAGYRFAGQVTRVSTQGATLVPRLQPQSRGVAHEDLDENAGARSIAVLPLKALTTGDVDDYLGLGVADALITRLSKIRRLRVRPTSAIIRYSGLKPDPVATGLELGVESVLEGSIQRAENRIRVTVQLVNTANGASLWADKFDESFTDIFGVEDSISERVASSLVFELSADERRLLRTRYTDNAAAYELYLRGRYYWNKRTTEWLKKGVRCFTEAIEMDPGYASAYAGLSDSYTLLVIHEALNPSEGFQKAKTAAETALKIDGSLGEAQASLAHALLHNWEWDSAKNGFDRAVELNPNYPSAHHWYSEYLMATGRLDEALIRIESALKLDPLSLIMNAHRADILFFSRRYEDSAAQCERVLEMDPSFFLAHLSLARAHGLLGNYERAVAGSERARALVPDSLEGAWMLGQVWAASGKRDRALAILNNLIAQSEQTYVSPCGIAMIYAALGEQDEAFKRLEQACELHDGEAFNLKIEPRFEILHSDPRWPAIIKRMGLEP